MFWSFSFVVLFLLFVYCRFQRGKLYWKQATVVVLLVFTACFVGSVFAETRGRVEPLFKIMLGNAHDGVVENRSSHLMSTSNQNAKRSKAQDEPATDNVLRDIKIPIMEITEKEGFALSVSKTNVLPGDIVELEAVQLDSTISADFLQLLVKGPNSKNVPSYIRRLTRDSNNVYKGSFTFKESDTGVFEFYVSLLNFDENYEESTHYFSNPAQVLVAHHPSSFIAIVFKDSPLIATQGDTSPIELSGVTRLNSFFYNISNPVLGTTYEIEDSSIATVSDAGFLEANAPGTTKLYAHYAGYTADMEIIVLSRDVLSEVLEDQKPANPTIVRPLEGTVINDRTVVFEVAPFDISQGHTFSASDWRVIKVISEDEQEINAEDVAHLDDGDSNTARWIASGPGVYYWSMKYYYDGFNTTESTPWTRFIISGDIEPPVSAIGVTLTSSALSLEEDLTFEPR